MIKYFVLSLACWPFVSFISFWIGYNQGQQYGEEKGWAKGYAMGKKVMEMVNRG